MAAEITVSQLKEIQTPHLLEAGGMFLLNRDNLHPPDPFYKGQTGSVKLNLKYQ